MKNSKFLKLYNLIMEDLNPISQLKNRIIEVLDECPNIDSEFWDIGKAQLLNDEIDLNKYQVVISGSDVFKLVQLGKTTGSGKYKWNNIKNKSLINLTNIKKDPFKNAIFYALKNGIKLNTPENAGNKEQLEQQQIEIFSNKLNDDTTIVDPNGDVRGPFNAIKKTEGNKLKSDATLYNNSDKSNDKIYISLKASKTNDPGSFNQYGGKRDLNMSDKEILETSKFLSDSYNKIVALFENLNIQSFDFSELNEFLSNYVYLSFEDNSKNRIELKSNVNKNILKAQEGLIKPINLTANFAFKVPHDLDKTEFDFLNKTKFGQEFGETNQSSPVNVDVLIDGHLNIDEKGKLEGDTHTEWNPSLYDVNDNKNETSMNYDLVAAFAPQQANGKFNEFKHCRFNLFPLNSGRVKNYIFTTKIILNHFK
jgi:hypothetical protein